MPGSLTVTVGANTSTLSMSATNSKINAVILRFLAARSIVTEGLTPVQIGDLFLAELKSIVVHVSSEKQRNELTEAGEATIEATIAADNTL